MAPSFLLKDVQIFTGETTIPTGVVYVQNGSIAYVGESTPSIPDDTLVISKPGHTVIPGLIDAHIHADKGNPLALRQSLRFGVTTVMDMHNEIPNVVALKRQAASEPNTSADFKTCGISATIDGGWPIPVVTAHDKSEETAAEIATWPKLKTEEDATAYVTQNIADGADYFKLMHESGASLGQSFPKPTIDLQKAVITAAHEKGFVTVAHALCLADHLEVLEAGIDGLTHGFFDAPPTPEVIEAYKKNTAWLNPTLAAIGSLTTEGQGLAEKFAHDPRGGALLGEREKGNLCRCMGFAKEGGTVKHAYELVKQLKAAGLDIIVGSDSAGPALGTAWGLSLHHELNLFVKECGFTPAEAIRAATAVTAGRFGFADRGLIAPGRRADLVLVEGDVLGDIDASLNLRGVWRGGVLAGAFEGKVGGR
ncbi:hypothetical protein EJ06DRAFT_482997 [Trichodelitschia bisporula]|uniref:Amidohydrolase-related domain-containing protein n=1 Tax=Trichodelitschia bisporula TaxID=703511 RepID=A0A6G1HLJ5_9PEZI|nr:hypothetical protein EJ06DRAFT_482997 [Trichodelitschia bisporula]